MLRFARYKSSMGHGRLPVVMRVSPPTFALALLIGLVPLPTSAKPAATEPATLPATRPAVTIQSLVQLQLVDGQIEARTDHAATTGPVTLHLSDPPASVQLTVLSRRPQAPPQEPDSMSLLIDQTTDAGLVRTSVFAVGGIVQQVVREVSGPNMEMSVQFIQSPIATPEDPAGVRLYIQTTVGEQEMEKATFPAADFPTLIRQYLEPTDQYLRPVFEMLGAQETLFSVSPALAAEVFADRMTPDAAFIRTVTDLVAMLDADRPQDRATAQAELEKLGQKAGLVLRKLDRSRLSLEQQTRIATILAPISHVSPIDAARLRDNTQFLLDALNCSEPSARQAALDELTRRTGRAIVFDPGASEPVRREKIRELRRLFTAPPRLRAGTGSVAPISRSGLRDSPKSGNVACGEDGILSGCAVRR